MTEPVQARITCERVTALLVDYIAGALDPALVPVFERHLERCTDCDAFLRTYRETVRATRTLRYDDIPQEMQNRLQAFLLHKITDKG
jgi:anti-sigma factor RsiW